VARLCLSVDIHHFEIEELSFLTLWWDFRKEASFWHRFRLLILTRLVGLSLPMCTRDPVDTMTTASPKNTSSVPPTNAGSSWCASVPSSGHSILVVTAGAATSARQCQVQPRPFSLGNNWWASIPNPKAHISPCSFTANACSTVFVLTNTILILPHLLFVPLISYSSCWGYSLINTLKLKKFTHRKPNLKRTLNKSKKGLGLPICEMNLSKIRGLRRTFITFCWQP